MPDEQTTSVPLPEFPAELIWTGDGSRLVPGVPARDLSEHDLNRLVYGRTSGKREGTSDGLRPGDEGHAEAKRDVMAELTGTNLYAALDARRRKRPDVEKE